MVVLIAGASHTGKTVLAQKLLEKYKYPYLSIDHVKMGLIRSGYTKLAPMDDEELVGYLWPVIREIIKTAVENNQNLIIEGAYIPFDWKNDFDEKYLAEIRYYCLIMTENYIHTHFADIIGHASDIENRLGDCCEEEAFVRDNNFNLQMCRKYNCNYILIDDEYCIDIEL